MHQWKEARMTKTPDMQMHIRLHPSYEHQAVEVVVLVALAALLAGHPGAAWVQIVCLITGALITVRTVWESARNYLRPGGDE
jgi:hypothetical protein